MINRIDHVLRLLAIKEYAVRASYQMVNRAGINNCVAEATDP